MYELIVEHGLGAFYACEVPAGTSQRTTGTGTFTDYAVLDTPDAARHYVEREAAGVIHARFAVPAIHCASCVWLVEQLWRFDAGVVSTEVDVLQRVVRVAFRASATSLRVVAERLAALGYPPVIENERDAPAPPRERRALYLRIGVAGFAFGNVMLFSIPRYANGVPLEPWFQRLFNALNLTFAIPVLLYSAAPYFTSAWRAIRARAITIDIPVALGLAVLFGRSVADIASGRGEGFLDSFSGLVFFLLIGRLLQQKAFDGIAFDRTVRSFLPLSVRVERAGALVPTRIEQLEPDDVVVIRAREVAPADAILLDTTGRVDYAFTTGESEPAVVRRGDPIAAGGRVVGHALRMRVVRPVSQSRLTAIWNSAAATRRTAPWLAEVSKRFGWGFTAAALLLAAIGAMLWWPDVAQAASVATAVLIIACPCALTLAAPITLGTAMGRLGRAGLYLKHPAVLLDLSRVDAVVFDKTGTLTLPDADVTQHGCALTNQDRELVSRLAAESVHPVSRAVAARHARTGGVTDVHDIPGCGITGIVDGHRVTIGTSALVAVRAGVRIPSEQYSGVSPKTWVAIDGRVAGWFSTGDRLRPGAIDAVTTLSRACRIRLLSGDRPVDTARWIDLFGGRAHFAMTPDDKLAAIVEERAEGRHVLMVGDGINDAGALMAADVGIAVSDDTACLVPACDAIVRGDRVTSLPDYLAYARRARRVVVACFVVSLAYNAIGLSLALAGRLTPLATAILMPVSSLTIVGLSVGLTRWRAPRPVSA